MRDRSVLWIAGLVALVVGLVAINLAMRPDAEPDFAPTSGRAAPGAAQGEPEPPAEPGEGDELPAELEADEPEVAAPEGEEAEAAAEALTCEHPFVPSAAGAWRRYSWRQSGEERAAVLRIEARSVRELEDGQREVTWRVEVTAADDRSELAREEMTTRCVPGRDAEEPWFGILERSLALRLTDEPRWRWPARLRAGERFEGTATFDPQGADMRIPAEVRGPQVLRVTRSHVVGEREAVEVPAGSYRAWRVDYEERHAFAERGEQGTGTIWVAPEVGMVRSRAENSEGVVQTIELVASGQRRR